MTHKPKALACATLAFLCGGSAVAVEHQKQAAQNAGKRYSLREKRGLLRFEVRGGDRWKTDLAATENKERSEVAFAPHYANGQDIVISFGMQIVGRRPSLAPWAVLGQIHTTPPPGVSRTPPVSQQLKGNRFFVIAEYEKPDGTVQKMRLAEDPNFARNQWHQFEYRARFATDQSGYLMIKQDGKQVADYHGPLGYKDERGLYFKVGIYRHASSDKLVVLYRNIVENASTLAQPEQAKD